MGLSPRTLRFPIRIKVAASGVVVALLISAFLGFFYPAQFHRDAVRAKREQVGGAAEMVALSVSVGLRMNAPSAVAEAFAWARRDSSLVYIAVVDTTGHVFASFDPDSVHIDPVRESTQRVVHEIDGMYVVSAPIRFQADHLGNLVLASSLAPIHLSIARQRRLGLTIGVAVLCVGGLLSLYVAGRIARPIVQLREAAHRIEAGEYDVEVPVRSRDEIGHLADAFVSMATKIRSQLSDLARQAAELAVARDTAVEATRAKSAFLATMSHEIRTPMNGVLGMLDLLRDDQLNAEQRQFADIAYQSAQALLAVINDILDFSKIEAGKLVLECTDFDPRAVLEDVAALLAVQAHAKGLELVCSIAHDVPNIVRGDPVRLRQVLFNLAGNAVKFTRHGEIVIRARVTETSATAILLHCEVTDSGIGLSSQDRAKLFQPFSQADASTTRKYGGTGLGLVICRQLVALMGGGDVSVESALGAGSTFGFTARLAPSTSSTNTNDIVPRLDAARVLVVGDNASMRASLLQELSGLGAECTFAANGPQALVQLAVLKGGSTPVIALVDADMPGMDGIAVARAMQAQPGFDKVRVVLLSRLTQRHDAKAVRAHGVAALLHKPVRRMKLATCIASVLSDDASVLPNETLAEPLAHASKTSGSVPAVRATAASTHGSAYILLAEDNLVNQQVATELLRRLGYRIDIASDGREAVEAAARGVYDVVLMDCQMPHMDGYEATAEIRRRGFDATRLPIIAMTADVLDGSRERCLNAGMNDFLSKPLQRDRIVAALAHWTKGSAAMVHDSLPAPQAPPATADDILDLGQLRSLVGEDVSTMRRFLDLFLKSSRPVLEEIDLAITSRRADVLRRALHGLKGSALSVGAKAVGERARDLEAAARQEDWTHVGPLHVKLTDALEQTTIITRDFGI